MSSRNKVFLLGRVGKDPDTSYSQKGTQITRFSMATQEYGQEKADWHNVVCFKKTAEIVSKYVSKGDQIDVEGKIQYSDYEDKNGNRRFKTEIIAWSVILLGKRSNESRSEPRSQPSPTTSTPPPASSTADDDLPF